MMKAKAAQISDRLLLNALARKSAARIKLLIDKLILPTNVGFFLPNRERTHVETQVAMSWAILAIRGEQRDKT